MRVSSGMMTNNYLNQLNRQYQKQADLMEQSDGSAIHRPSDDPVAFAQTMTAKFSLAKNERYSASLDTAQSWMDSTDDAMVNMKEILTTIVEKTSEAANGTNTTTDTAATAEEIKSYIDELVSQANTQVGNSYIFAGSADTTKPYTVGTVTAKADVKTLDDTQSELFGTKQMLILTDSSSNTYYLDTTNGNLYAKDYVDSGYKTTVANNSTATAAAVKTAVQSNASGTLDAFTSSTATTTATQAEVFMSSTFNTNGTLTATTNSFTSTISGSTTLTFSTSDKTVVTYSGNDDKISMPIQTGDADPDKDSVNSTGADLFGTDIFGGVGSELINNLYEIADKMENGDTTWLSSDGITLANNAHDQVVSAEVTVASRNASYNLSKTTMENQNTQINTDITNLSASDTAELIVSLQTAQTLYNMSLSVGANILPLSLADYLS